MPNTENENIYSKVFSAFDTTVTFKLWICDIRKSDAKRRAVEIFNYIEALCAHYEKLFSRTLANSDLARLNDAGGLPVIVSPELAELVNASLRYCRITQGRFDISMGTVTSLWDFHTGKIPEKLQLLEALQHVDYRQIEVVGNSISLHDVSMRIDLGGIAKGYICDKIVDYLRAEAADVGGGIIDLGGNLYVLGTKPDGTEWSVGVRNPQNKSEIIAACKLKNVSIVTSGIYERAFEHEGRLFHHILDPITGYPVQSDIAGITLISEKSLDGDGYTTGLLMMGCSQAVTFLKTLPSDIDFVIVTTTGEIYYSVDLIEHGLVLSNSI